MMGKTMPGNTPLSRTRAFLCIPILGRRVLS
jgi:hypothetical protein